MSQPGPRKLRGRCGPYTRFGRPAKETPFCYVAEAPRSSMYSAIPRQFPIRSDPIRAAPVRKRASDSLSAQSFESMNRVKSDQDAALHDMTAVPRSSMNSANPRRTASSTVDAHPHSGHRTSRRPTRLYPQLPHRTNLDRSLSDASPAGRSMRSERHSHAVPANHSAAASKGNVHRIVV